MSAVCFELATVAKAVLACPNQPRGRVSSLTYSWARLGEPLGWFVVAITLMCVTAAALVLGGLVVALPVALLPAFLLLTGNDAVLKFVVLAVSAVAVLGRDLAYIQVGPLYSLDLVLLAALVLALPQIARGAETAPVLLAIVLGLVGITLIRLGQAGLDATTLRQSVIGFYALWATIGVAMAARGICTYFARALAIGSVLGLAVYGAVLLAPGNPFSQHFTPRIINAAGSLYASFALLAVLFAPSLLGRRTPRAVVLAVGLVALTEIAAGQVRSIWVALVVAVPAVYVVSGFTGSKQKGVWTLVLLGSILCAGAALLTPNVLGPLRAEATSIYRVSDSTISAANASWRLDVGREALVQIVRHPLGGIGFGPPETYITGPTDPTDLHNSYLGMGYRLGIPGVLLLFAFEGSVLISAFHFLRRSLSDGQRTLMQWLVGCQVLTATHAAFTVVLEGPYMGLFFWLLGGVIAGFSMTVREPRTALSPVQ